MLSPAPPTPNLQSNSQTPTPHTLNLSLKTNVNPWCRVQGLGFRVQGLDVRVWGLGCLPAQGRNFVQRWSHHHSKVWGWRHHARGACLDDHMYKNTNPESLANPSLPAAVRNKSHQPNHCLLGFLASAAAVTPGLAGALLERGQFLPSGTAARASTPSFGLRQTGPSTSGPSLQPPPACTGQADGWLRVTPSIPTLLCEI